MKGVFGFLRDVFWSERREFLIWTISYFYAGISLSFLRDLWKVA